MAIHIGRRELIVALGGAKLLEPWGRPSHKITAVVLLTVVVAVGSLILHVLGRELTPYQLRLVFHESDMDVYFRSASWVIEGGRLYRDVPSEYPLFANVIFAITRYLGNLLLPGLYGFYIVWMSLAWIIYFSAVNAVITRTTKLAALAWLAPAPIFFALYRFDIYPAAATLASLFAIKRMAYLRGAAWLGLAIALKGYALFFLPAYVVFIIHQRGFAAAIKGSVLAVSPQIFSMLATFSFAGWEGMLAPFKHHAVRTLNGESTFDAINYLFGTSIIPAGIETVWIARCLQIGFAFAAAAMRPRTFEELVNALLLAALGFMSFSVFYSPQFVLWILPLICFLDSWVILVSAVLFSWLTYVYFPVIYNLGKGHFFRMMIIAISCLRLVMIFLVCSSTYSTSARSDRGSSMLS
jgi:hypothetical protein